MEAGPSQRDAFFVACRAANYAEVVRWLGASPSLVNCQLDEHVASLRAFAGWTPLLVASDEEDAELVRQLLSRGADPNLGDEDGLTPLHVAASRGHDEIVDVLLSHGADVNLGCGENWTALHWAAAGAHPKAVRLLLDKGADVHARGPDYAPARAARVPSTMEYSTRWAGLLGFDKGPQAEHEERFREVMRLLEDAGGYDPDEIREAAEQGNLARLEWLLARDPSLAKYEAPNSPSADAVCENHIGAVRILLAHGADPQAEDRDEEFVLHIAAREGFAEIARLLVEAGADLTARNWDNRSAYDVALEHGHTEIASFLWAAHRTGRSGSTE